MNDPTMTDVPGTVSCPRCSCGLMTDSYRVWCSMCEWGRDGDDRRTVTPEVVAAFMAERERLRRTVVGVSDLVDLVRSSTRR